MKDEQINEMFLNGLIGSLCFIFLYALWSTDLIDLWNDTTYSILNQTDWMGFYILLSLITTAMIVGLLLGCIQSICSIKNTLCTHE